MTYFANALAQVLERLEMPQSQLATRMKITPGLISRYTSGHTRPTPETLVKLWDALEIPDAAEVLIGHLRDETPPKAAPHVMILPADGGRVSEEAPLPNDIEAAIEALKRRAVAEPDFAAWLRKTAQWMS